MSGVGSYNMNQISVSNNNITICVIACQCGVCFGCHLEMLGRDRFESTASAGRRISSANPIDLPLPIPEDPLPSSAKRGGRR